MPTNRATRIRPATLTAIPFILWLCRSANAATGTLAPDCSTSGATINCRLQGFLHFLYGAAGILALILLGVILLAIRFYSRNKTNPKAGE